MIIIYSILIVCLLIASIFDASTKKIPNWISLTIIVSGLGWNYFSAEGLGLKDSGLGLIVGLLLMLPGYVFGGMGAGDVKLMSAIGSVVGLSRVLEVVFYSYMVMFVMAITFVIVKGDLFKLLLRYKALFFGLFAGIFSYQKPDSSEAAGQRVPLAPAIALGTFYVLYPQFCNLEFMADLCHF